MAPPTPPTRSSPPVHFTVLAALLVLVTPIRAVPAVPAVELAKSILDVPVELAKPILDESAKPAAPLPGPGQGQDADEWWREKLEELVRRQEALGEQQPVLEALNKHATRTRDLVEANGYPVEEYTARTDDGYLLGVIRVPRPRPGSPVVFLMHGLLASSADYVALGKGRALALLLHDAGFDVWMGNARGTTESRRHAQRSPSEAAFWDFSWHEIGALDLPACIDLALNETGQASLHYVGHSQGTTSFFVLGSERPEYMAKIRTYIALAPVAFVRDIRSAPVRLMALAPNTLGALLKLIGINEFLPSSDFVATLGGWFCGESDITQPICSNTFFLLCGFDSQQLNKTILPEIISHTPAGASTKQLLHYGQLIDSWKLRFRQFDHGWISNYRKYGSLYPPDYDLSKVTAPTFLFHADNDLMSVQTNLDELHRTLPNIVEAYRVPFDRFNHIDYLYANDVVTLVYDHLISILHKY